MLHIFNTTAMSAAAKVINSADLLAHIASFMHFSSDPEQKAADDGYRLALLPSRSMLPSSRAKVMGLVSEWTTAQMLAYLIRRTAYISRQIHVRPAGSEMPIDLRVVAGQLDAWVERRSDELRAMRSRVLCFKLHQIMHMMEALHREHSRWDAIGAPLFVGARERLGSIAQAVNNNIKADSLRREMARFDPQSQALLEIIAARLTAPLADQPTELERAHLRLMRGRIEEMRKLAAGLSQASNERFPTTTRLEDHLRMNKSLEAVAVWLSTGQGAPPFAETSD